MAQAALKTPMETDLRSARNLVELFERQAARQGTRPAVKHKRDGRWQEVSWKEMARRARDVADGLAALGVQPGDRISILGETQLEWNVADVGVMGAGAITVPIYQSNPAHECQYILEHSGASWIFVDSEAQAAKIREVLPRLPGLKGVIRFTGDPRGEKERTLESLEREGAAWREAHPQAHAERVARIGMQDTACILYTSGTTGNPKGVVLTHGNWTYEARAIAEITIMEPEDTVLFFLPMAHSFAKVIQASWFSLGSAAAFVESLEKIVDNAGEVRPTTMPSVPRIFEKAYNAVVAKGMQTPGLKGKLFALAMRGFDDWADGKVAGQERSSFAFTIGKKLVFPKLAQALSERFGGRMRGFVSGGAPLSPKIGWFFNLLGFTILEGWGLTETSAGTCVNRFEKNKIGTVGPPVPGTEIAIAEDGEVLVRGGGVMKEYYRNPAATAEVIRDGWLYTGDIGELDRDGYLRITDRKKDLIKTSGGKYVAPQNLENELKADPLISQVMVHGDQRKFIAALITLNEEAARKWAAENGVPPGAALHEDPRVVGRIHRTVDALNAKQASYSAIKKFALLPRDFSIESGELTPTLKVKRKFCAQKYKAILDAFYVE
ncbi:MAG TPA: long-chain fatty acid--CoA ligase [Anaeromyxobacteraceae bacterium]|nr:long-chain fatty acid--CoA ligase [Anaeromyxobacteraceae bacterium]